MECVSFLNSKPNNLSCTAYQMISDHTEAQPECHSSRLSVEFTADMMDIERVCETDRQTRAFPASLDTRRPQLTCVQVQSQ